MIAMTGICFIKAPIKLIITTPYVLLVFILIAYAK